MEINSNLNISGQVEQFYKSLPEEGVILHVNRSRNREKILERGIRGPHNMVWFFAFQTSSKYCMPDFSPKSLRTPIMKLRGTLRNVLPEISKHNISGNFRIMTEDEYPAVVVARRLLKNKQASTNVFCGHTYEFEREVAQSIPADRILFITSLSKAEHQALQEKMTEDKMPSFFKRYREPQNAYFNNLLARMLARKVASGLLTTEYPTHAQKTEASFKGFWGKILSR